MIGLLIFTLCFVPGILLRLAPFKKQVSKKKMGIIGSLQLAVLILNYLCLFFTTKYIGIGLDVMKVDIFIFGVLTSAINILVLRTHIKEHLFTCGLIMIQDFLVVSGVTYVLSNILHFSDIPYLLIIISMYCLTVELIFYWFFRTIIVDTVRPFLTLNADNYWNSIWFISAIIFTSCFFTLPLSEIVSSKYTLTTLFLQYIVIIVVCRAMVNDSLEMKEKLQLEKGLSLQQNHYIELATRIEEARKSRHDFKHHITVLHQYLDNEDYDGLREHCNELMSRNKLNISIPYTGNPAVDGIMYHYASIAKEKGIRFDYKKINPPDISDVDLCTLLGNAIDNAVTACEYVKENPFIQVISNGEGAGMQLLIRNSYDGVIKKDKDKFLTRKTKGDHGIGISSMQEICQNNNILMKIAYTDDTFDVLFVF